MMFVPQSFSPPSGILCQGPETWRLRKHAWDIWQKDKSQVPDDILDHIAIPTLPASSFSLCEEKRKHN